MNFEDIRKQALIEWDKLWQNEKTLILVGSATCSRAAGALNILDALRKELPKYDVDATTIEVGCIGLLLWQGYPRNCKAKSTKSIETQARKLESPKNRKGGLNCVEDHKKRKMA
jgi:hypothetical protein